MREINFIAESITVLVISSSDVIKKSLAVDIIERKHRYLHFENDVNRCRLDSISTSASYFSFFLVFERDRGISKFISRLFASLDSALIGRARELSA